MPGVYGGDDVSAIVLDPGSSLLRAGWAGEDTPRVVVPSSYGWVADDSAPAPPTEQSNESSSNDVDMADGEGKEEANGSANGQEGSAAAKTEAQDPRTRYLEKKASSNAADGKKKIRYFGDSGVNQWRRNMEVAPTVVDGVVQSVPDLFHMFEDAIATLGASSSEHPLLLTEAAWTPRETREELTEMAFEGLGVPAYYLANSTVLSSFSAGKPTSVILDVGYSSVSAIPVVDGFVIRKGIMRQTGLGGAAVSRALAHELKNPPPRAPRIGGPIQELVPMYRVKSKKPVDAGRPAQWEEREDRKEGTTESYQKHHEEKLLHEAKESLVQVLDQPWDEGQALGRPSRPFEFPNGYNDMFGIERLRASEVMFENSLWNGVEGVLPQPSSSGSSSTSPLASVPQMVMDAIAAVDVDSRPTLLSNIVCVGGGTFVPGFVDRLNFELTARAPAQKIKIHSPGNSVERRHSSWLGGSVLASLGSFHQMWISKQEYDEHGAAIVHARAR